MTLTVTIEPDFLALTTTPSMAPSASEVTWPVRAAGGWFCAAICGADGKRMTAKLAVKICRRRLVRILSWDTETIHSQFDSHDAQESARDGGAVTHIPHMSYASWP